MDQQQYKLIEEKYTPPTPYVKNMFKAFFVGGIICVIGQAITYFYIIFFDFTDKTAGNATVATMVLLSMILTGLGIYKKLGQFAGAGTAIPVTGFGNAIVSSAIEHRSEGLVLGVGSQIFKLAGSVIVFGVVASFFVALIKLILVNLGVAEW